ncbi:MAG: hypothetical protein KDD34_04235 [Bdellovibrionales bacterium]|nr:hypothetical protein [Bdellovibrionales bacterium]
MLIQRITKIFIIAIALGFQHYATASEDAISLKAFNGEDLPMTVVSYKEVSQLFSYIMKQKYIPFDLVADGCHARAQQIADLAAYKKIIGAKIVVEASPEKQLLIHASDGPWIAHWDYHIALVIMVKTYDEKLKPYVIDPTFFSQPVPQELWLEKIFENTPLENQKASQIYYVSRFTLDPGGKNIVFDSLPARLEQEIPGMLNIFSINLKNMGTFYEKCIIKDLRTKKETIGGLDKELVPDFQKFEICKPAGI